MEKNKHQIIFMLGGETPGIALELSIRNREIRFYSTVHCRYYRISLTQLTKKQITKNRN